MVLPLTITLVIQKTRSGWRAVWLVELVFARPYVQEVRPDAVKPDLVSLRAS